MRAKDEPRRLNRERVVRTPTFWLRPEFVLRVVNRFQKVAGFDRAIALGSSALTAMIPLLIVLVARWFRRHWNYPTRGLGSRERGSCALPSGAGFIVPGGSSPMQPKLPPPDPHETFEMTPTGGHRVSAPTAVFVMGPASPESDRVADCMLDLGPGVFIVLTV